MKKLTKESCILAIMLMSLFFFAHIVGTKYQNWSKFYPFFHWSLFSYTPSTLSDVKIRLFNAQKDCLLHECRLGIEGKEILQIYQYLKIQQDIQAIQTPDISNHLQHFFGIDSIDYVIEPLSYIELLKSLKSEQVIKNE